MSRLSRSFPLAMALLLLGACAGAPRVEDIKPLQKELPPDLEAKFGVVEATPVPSPLPGAKAKSIAKKEKKRKGPPPFAYPDRRPQVNPVWIGEKQVLEVTYIGLKAGDFTLDVLPTKMLGGRMVYHLQAKAVSSSMLNFFYRLNDTIESFWDYEGLFSHRFHLMVDESKQKRDALELYDSEAKKDFYWSRRNHVEKGISESKDAFDMEQSFPQDSFSALYYLRTLPLEDGKSYTFPVVTEGRNWEAVVNVVRREMLDTPLGKKMCIVVRPQTRFGGVMKQENGDSFFWLTDDDRRFVARFEAQVKVGSVAGRLKHVELGEKPNAK